MWSSRDVEERTKQAKLIVSATTLTVILPMLVALHKNGGVDNDPLWATAQESMDNFMLSESHNKVQISRLNSA